jgi:hypothetical protein
MQVLERRRPRADDDDLVPEEAGRGLPAERVGERDRLERLGGAPVVDPGPAERFDGSSRTLRRDDRERLQICDPVPHPADVVARILREVGMADPSVVLADELVVAEDG